MQTDSLAWRRVVAARDAIVFVLVACCWVTWIVVIPMLSFWPGSPMARAVINATGGHGRALAVTYLWPFAAFPLIGVLLSISAPSERAQSHQERDDANADEVGAAEPPFAH
jgi:hypothetical protein